MTRQLLKKTDRTIIGGNAWFHIVCRPNHRWLNFNENECSLLGLYVTSGCQRVMYLFTGFRGQILQRKRHCFYTSPAVSHTLWEMILQYLISLLRQALFLQTTTQTCKGPVTLTQHLWPPNDWVRPQKKTGVRRQPAPTSRPKFAC